MQDQPIFAGMIFLAMAGFLMAHLSVSLKRGELTDFPWFRSGKAWFVGKPVGRSNYAAIYWMVLLVLTFFILELLWASGMAFTGKGWE